MGGRQSAPDDESMWDAYHRFHYQCDTHRFQKLFARIDLFRMVADLPGDIVDAGVFKGVSTIQWAHLLAGYQPNSRSKVIAFDTFEAKFPRTREDERPAAENHECIYRADAHDTLLAALKRLRLEERVEIVRGDIVGTLPSYLDERPGLRINLLHCDMDVFAPTLATLEKCWPRLVPGGVVVFDEYAVANWGESDAVDQFFAKAAPNLKLKLLPASPTPTAYVIKPFFGRGS